MRWEWLACLAALAFTAVGCDGDDEMTDAGPMEDDGGSMMMDDAGDPTPDAGIDGGPGDDTIVGVAAADGRFTVLVAALERTGLDDTLRGAGPFTVFAPTDDAFGDLLTELGAEGLEDIDNDTLETFLLNHVLAGEVLAANIPSDPPIADNAADLTLWFGSDGGSVTVNEATVTQADVTAPTNGVIHVVDDVINPADIPAMAGFAGLTSLAGALADRELVDDLQADGPFTVFAPTNAAFTALGSGAPTGDALAAALLYHVVGASVEAGDIPSGVSTASTLSAGPVTDGPTLTLLLNNDGSSVAVNDATVTIADIKVTNGVIHVVDTVIVPPDIPTMAGIAGLTGLAAALTEASLLTATASGATGAPFTVFAPTNAAFTALYDALGSSVSGPADLDDGLLTGTLLYHVVGGAAIESGDVADPGPAVVSTLSPPPGAPSGAPTMTVLASRDGTDVTVNGANVVIADIVTTSGIVHVIDEVLLAPDIPTMAGIAGLTSLVAALEDRSLVSALEASGPFTVFAPTNAAFAALLTALGAADIAAIDDDVLAGTLLYHVTAAGAVAAGDLDAGANIVPTLADPDYTDGDTTIADKMTLIVIESSGAVTVNGANVVIADVVTTNGIVHVIDEVVLRPTVADLPTLAGLTTLASAVGSAGLGATLAGAGPFTVFAPTDAAFSALSSLPSGAALTNTLLYHAVSAEAMSDEVTAGTLPTLAPSNPTVTIGTSGGVTVEGQGNGGNASNVVIADVVGANGVVHVIDRVLLLP